MSRDGKERIDRSPEFEDIARRLGSCNRLKRVSRWYWSVLKGMEGVKTCFASLGEIWPEDLKNRRCLFCLFSEMKDSDWFIPVTMVPFPSVLRSRLNTFEVTAKVIGASSSELNTYSDTTFTFVVVSSSTTFSTLATIYIKQFPKGRTILFLTPKLPTPPPPEAMITSSFCQANAYTGKPTSFFTTGILGAIFGLPPSNVMCRPGSSRRSSIGAGRFRTF